MQPVGKPKDLQGVGFVMLFKGLKDITAGAAALNLLLSVIALAGSQKVALLVQQTPNEAGSVSPPSGVYNLDSDSTVEVTAQPVKGYEFVYWLGDVADPTAATTRVVLDKPKIVVAVFSPTNADQIVRSFSVGAGASADGETQYLGNGGPVQTIASARDYVRNGFSQTGGGSEGGGTTPVPEPLTVMLFSAGAAVLAIKRRRD